MDKEDAELNLQVYKSLNKLHGSTQTSDYYGCLIYKVTDNGVQKEKFHSYLLIIHGVEVQIFGFVEIENKLVNLKKSFKLPESITQDNNIIDISVVSFEVKHPTGKTSPKSLKPLIQIVAKKNSPNWYYTAPSIFYLEFSLNSGFSFDVNKTTLVSPLSEDYRNVTYFDGELYLVHPMKSLLRVPSWKRHFDYENGQYIRIFDRMLWIKCKDVPDFDLDHAETQLVLKTTIFSSMAITLVTPLGVDIIMPYKCAIPQINSQFTLTETSFDNSRFSKFQIQFKFVGASNDFIKNAFKLTETHILISTSKKKTFLLSLELKGVAIKKADLRKVKSLDGHSLDKMYTVIPNKLFFAFSKTQDHLVIKFHGTDLIIVDRIGRKIDTCYNFIENVIPLGDFDRRKFSRSSGDVSKNNITINCDSRETFDRTKRVELNSTQPGFVLKRTSKNFTPSSKVHAVEEYWINETTVLIRMNDFSTKVYTIIELKKASERDNSEKYTQLFEEGYIPIGALDLFVRNGIIYHIDPVTLEIFEVINNLLYNIVLLKVAYVNNQAIITIIDEHNCLHLLKVSHDNKKYKILGDHKIFESENLPIAFYDIKFDDMGNFKILFIDYEFNSHLFCHNTVLNKSEHFSPLFNSSELDWMPILNAFILSSPVGDSFFIMNTERKSILLFPNTDSSQLKARIINFSRSYDKIQKIEYMDLKRKPFTRILCSGRDGVEVFDPFEELETSCLELNRSSLVVVNPYSPRTILSFFKKDVHHMTYFESRSIKKKFYCDMELVDAPKFLMGFKDNYYCFLRRLNWDPENDIFEIVLVNQTKFHIKSVLRLPSGTKGISVLKLRNIKSTSTPDLASKWCLVVFGKDETEDGNWAMTVLVDSKGNLKDSRHKLPLKGVLASNFLLSDDTMLYVSNSSNCILQANYDVNKGTSQLCCIRKIQRDCNDYTTLQYISIFIERYAAFSEISLGDVQSLRSVLPETINASRSRLVPFMSLVEKTRAYMTFQIMVKTAKRLHTVVLKVDLLKKVFTCVSFTDVPLPHFWYFFQEFCRSSTIHFCDD